MPELTRSRLVGMCIVRDEADILPFTLLHHHRLGVRAFLVADTGSEDGTRDVLREMALRLPLRWTISEGPYRPAELKTALAREASSLGASWVVPFDADEFWHPGGGSFSRALRRRDAGALSCPVINLVQRRDQIHPDPQGLIHVTHRVAAPRGPAERAEEMVEAGEIGLVEMVYPPKVLFRPAPEVSVDRGHHSVVGAPGPAAASTDPVCLHAPIRSFEQLRRKAATGRRVIEGGFTGNESWHMRRWARLEDEGKLEDEWAANSYRDGALDVWGERHPLVEDRRLADAVAPLVPVVEEIRERAGLRRS